MTTKKKLPKKLNYFNHARLGIKNIFSRLRRASQKYLSRRPHRSFKQTRRRDYTRSLTLPGYWAFTAHVYRTLRESRRTFLLLALLSAILTVIMVGTASQDTYTTLTDTLRQTGTDVFQGNLGELGKAGLLFVTAATGGLSQTLTEVQQVYAGLIALLTWLVTVWLLRNLLAGHKVRLRDGLYNAAAPLLSTFIIALVLVVQLLPLALALIGYSAAVASGLLSGGVEAMLFWLVAGLLGLLSLYWITSTLVALVVVTLPGMYPLRALQTAGDLVIGRRVRILLRLAWMMFVVLLAWVLVMIPVILFDTWLKGLWPSLQGIPIIPFVLLVLSSLTIVWSASYIYLLYRKVVADDAQPA
ncbi:hypothetical protein H7X69_02950 [Candidatus Saccharibacteria bacterium]|nr:hypothetical protein [Candidatus Saccharibacteria bacterium]